MSTQVFWLRLKHHWNLQSQDKMEGNCDLTAVGQWKKRDNSEEEMTWQEDGKGTLVQNRSLALAVYSGCEFSQGIELKGNKLIKLSIF